MEPQYREAEVADLVRISEIFNDNIRRGDSTLWQREFTAKDLQEEILQYDDREAMYVLNHGDTIIGFGVIRKYHPKKGYAQTCDTSVFLDRDYTGQGFGSDFKQFILEECKRLKYHHVVAKILASNTVSINYNLKLGYSMVGIQKEAGRVNGQYVDIAILQYIIK